MSNYRRLISYIYVYEGGVKGKNIGFAKIEIRNGQCKIHVNVKRIFLGSSDIGVYLLSPNKEILLGRIFIRNGAGEFRASVSAGNVEGSGCTMEQCYGLTIHETESTWRTYTTIWEDAVTQAAEVELANVTSDKVGAQFRKELRPSVSKEIQRELEREELSATGMAQREESSGKEASQKREMSSEKPIESDKVFEPKVIQGGEVSVEEPIQTENSSEMGTIRPEESLVLGAVLSEDSFLKGAVQRKETSVQGVTHQEDYFIQGNRQSENFSVQGTNQSENFSIPGTNQPENFSVQGTNQPENFSVQGMNQPENFSVQETNQSEKSSVQGINQPEKSSIQGINQPEKSSIQGTNQPENFSVQETNQPEKSSVQETSPSENSSVQGTVPSESSSVQESARPEEARTPKSAETGKFSATETGMAGESLATGINWPEGFSDQEENSEKQGQDQEKGGWIQGTPVEPLWKNGNSPVENQVRTPGPSMGMGDTNNRVNRDNISDKVLKFAKVFMQGKNPETEESFRQRGKMETSESGKKMPYVMESGKKTLPEPGNPERLKEWDRQDQEENAKGSIWNQLQRRYAKVLAFDYDYGCEILSIKPQDIGILPRENWVYGNNSFLLHGYYNYRHLILARLENPEGEIRYLLGVPGHYFSNEKNLASMFGFPHFVLARKQPEENGRFGYWYTDLRL